MNRWALITGASAGLGAEFARQYAENGYSLVLTARRGDRLEALSRELKVKCLIVTADLADPSSPRRIFEEIERQGIKIDVLVNNAGFGTRGTYLSKPWADHARLIQVMVNAVCELTHLFLPGMIERGYGRIINVASIAGFLPPTKQDALYGASKSLVIKFSQGVRAQTIGSGVNITALCPGFFYSEFHDVLGVRAEVRKTSKVLWMTTEHVVREGIAGVEKNKAVVIPGRIYKVIGGLLKLMPQKLGSWLLSGASRR